MIRFAIPLLLFAPAALAHPGHEHSSGFVAGIAHPFLGLDHLLAMIALGVWAAQWKGRDVLAAPTIFIAGMLLGATYALTGGALSFAEHGIALSVLGIGLLIALVPGHKAAARIALPVVALGAAMHGYAHVAEVPSHLSAGTYIAGFALATAALHALGIAIGMTLNPRMRLRRIAGALVALSGVVLIAA